MAGPPIPSAPATGHGRSRLKIIIAIVVTVLLLALIAGGALWLLRRSATPAPTPSVDPATGLPAAGNQDQAAQSVDRELDPPVPDPGADDTITATSENIGISIAYSRTPQFSLEIEEIKATNSRPTIQDYAPSPESPYSIIKLLDGKGQTVAEEKFSIATSVIVEGIGVAPRTEQLEEGTVYLVLTPPQGSQLTKAVITSPDGTVISEKTFTLSVNPNKQHERGAGKNLVAGLIGFFKGKPASAQGALPPFYVEGRQSSGCFQAGDDVRSSITVYNNSRSSSLQNVTVTLQSPSTSLSLTSATPAPSTIDQNSQRFIWQVGTLAPGQSQQFSVIAHANQASSSVSMTLSATADGQPTARGNFTVSQCAIATPPPANSILTARVVGTPCFQYPGTQEFTYTIEVKNNTTSTTFNNVDIYYQPFTTNSRLIRGSPTPDVSDPDTLRPTRFIWRPGTMAIGDSRQYSVTLAPRNQTTLIHVVFYANPQGAPAAYGDHDISPCGAPTPTPLTAVTAELTKDANDKCYTPGEDFILNGKATNTIDTDISNPEVRFTHAENTVFVSGQPPPDQTLPDQRQAVWNVALLAANGSVDYTITFKPTEDATQPLKNTLQVQYTNPVTNQVETALATITINPCDGDKYIIAVINEVGGADKLDGVIGTVKQMRDTIQPWRKYKSRIEIIKIVSTTSLGCQLEELLPGTAYPRCSNDSLVINTVAATVPNWDTIIVVHPHSCTCGSVATNFPPIATFGSIPDIRLTAHELGHSVGKMTDEYLYQYGSTQGISGPNCFQSQNQCVDAIQPFPGAECSLGCNRVSTWRPATKMMHNTYDEMVYGPLEECLLGKKIAEALGENYDCQLPSPTPTPTALPGEFWGWFN